MNSRPLPKLPLARRLGWTGGTGRELLSLAWPLAVQSLAYALLGVIDRVMVGQLAEKPIAAVGIGGQLLFFTVTLAGSVAQAVAILAAQLRGARDPAGLANLTGTGLALSLALGILFNSALLWMASPAALWLSNGDAGIAAMTVEYLGPIALTGPFVLLTFVITGIMRSLGDTRTPLVSSMVALVSNTGLNLLLINGYGGFPRLGILGAALATAVSQIAGCLMAILYFLARRFDLYAFEIGHLACGSRKMAGQVLRLALPIGLDGLFWQAASLAYTRVVGLAGPDALPAYFMYQGIRGLGYIPLGALGSAAAIIVGRHLGAGHPARATMAVRRSVAMAVGSSLLMGLLYLLIAAPYLWFFAVKGNVAAEAGLLIRAFALVLPFEAAIVVLAGVLRAGGDALMVSLMTFSSFWLVGIPMAWLLGVKLGFGLPGCFVGMSLESVAKAFLFLRRERSGRWARLKLARR